MLTIHMTKSQALNLARFLNHDYSLRVDKFGHGYSVQSFADELKIKRGTLGNLMDERKPVQGLDADILMALYDFYKDEVMQALRGDAEVVKRNKEAAAKKKKG